MTILTEIYNAFNQQNLDEQIGSLLFEHKGYISTYTRYDFSNPTKPVLTLSVIDKRMFECLLTADVEFDLNFQDEMTTHVGMVYKGIIAAIDAHGT